MPTHNTPSPTPDHEVDEQALANAIPPEPSVDDPVTGPEDDSWRHPEPAEEPKGHREAQIKERDEAAKANAEMSEASQAASLAKK